GRTQLGFANVIGLFANPIALRADFSGNPTFAEFIEHVRQKVSGALIHQDYPFSLLVKRLGVPRQANRPPLVQALFAHQTPRRAAASFGWGSLLELIKLPQREGAFDVALETFESGRNLSGWFKYRTDRLTAAFVARMAEHYQTLLRGVVQD